MCGRVTPTTSLGPISRRFGSRRSDRETSTPPTPGSRTSAGCGLSSGLTGARPRRQPTRALTLGPLPGVTRNTGGRMIARHLATVAAVAALVGGMLAESASATPQSDNADAQRNTALVKSGPMTPAKAALLGKSNVDFGPNCDMTTGRVKIPTVYAPPCVQPFTGKNGGATAQGVTDTEIKVVVFVGDPSKDPVLAGQLIAAGASLDPNSIKATWQGYIDIF